ncbi:MAG TPA: peptidylprolyl isomerase [Tabrizicola sp.]|nr:peptidylprolyl isomerase [Tabrizicola sp.]
MGAPLFPPVFVNGVEIPHAAIAAEAQLHSAPKGKPGLAWKAAALALAMREVLLTEARARGLVAAPQTTGPGLRETEDEALIRGLIETAVTPVEPEEAELFRFWQENPERFLAPDLWEVAHILLPAAPEDAEARASAQSLAVGILAILSREPGRFADLAARHSACSSRASGGMLGQIGPGDTVPEFEAALLRLAPGQITEQPVATRFGLHLIRLDAHARGEVLPYPAVAARLRAAACKRAWTRAAHDFAKALMAKAQITGLDQRTAA